MKYQNIYQAALIFFALLVVFAISVFVYKELFPEYKSYQFAYKKLEKLRSDKPAPFDVGIKQIIIPDPENGPEIIDRCTSCHVAMNLPHFSPTRVALDVNDNPILDESGIPHQEPNPDYVFLNAPQKLQKYRGALNAHPLIGAETKPFEFHPVEEYGCTSCHSGNGRSLVAKRAHGPVSDYEEAHAGLTPQFLELDERFDPPFSKRYNGKPGHDLTFQTKPLLVGPLIEAKCMQCHQTAQDDVSSTVMQINQLTAAKEQQLADLREAVEDEKEALLALLNLQRLIAKRDVEKTIRYLEIERQNFLLTPTQIDALEGQIAFLKEGGNIASSVEQIVGSEERAEELLKVASAAEDVNQLQLLVNQQSFTKAKVIEEQSKKLQEYEEAKEGYLSAVQDKQLIATLKRGPLFAHYERGRELYISQSCYACHRIAGLSRASIGPELTQIGLSYPWYVKESIVWPQADLPSSTMPNFHLDHQEVEDLMAFLMAQTGMRKTHSEVDQKVSIAQWEAGAKLPWEEPIAPTELRNLHFGQTVFATQGCASCHRLEGFDSHVKPTDRAWFERTFPENILGSTLAERIQEKGEEIDHKFLATKQYTLLMQLEQRFPGLLIGFYPNFKFASRVDESEKYQRRLNTVLQAMIGEYGLGREIAPPLNWSGVMRSDAWLLGHFRNPAAYTARSLMPSMPFDDTKFFALNYMLKEMGKRNRDKLQKRWEKEGFSPSVAYQTLCASCHGDQRQGNGPVAQWIYPVPKNLRNPVFLRNLTKKEAIDSITMGVVGTPMPPWGEGVLSD
nr:c-type cytochrome [Chlamydiota bacterium]